MKSEKNILIAFILNLSFSIFEFIGGIFTGSVSIISDSVHDIGDAMSIGVSYFLERKSKKKPDNKFTYGYARFSTLGGVFTTLILLLGSGIVIYSAIRRIINPTTINYNGMIIFAVVGVIVNILAAYFTREGDSINQKAVNLHMIEDVFGWIVVLVGAVIIKFTDFVILDPIMSIVVALFIIISSIKNLKEIIDIFLVKTPKGINVDEIKNHILEIDGVVDVHHIHIWTLDGQNNSATMHIVSSIYSKELKDKIKNELAEHNIAHSTLEFEYENENCEVQDCDSYLKVDSKHHHHHHHH